jgi:uncharacterized protein (TIGR02145 family)
MKKLIILMIAVMCAGVATGQGNKQKVAVYVSGETEEGVNEFVGAYLVDAIVKNGSYAAIERTSDFLAELQKEQNYQRSGAVDDRQIAKLGIRFGVQLVCVVNVRNMGEKQFVSSRLIDVETADVLSSTKPMIFSLEDVENICSALTKELLDNDPRKIEAARVAEIKAAEAKAAAEKAAEAEAAIEAKAAIEAEAKKRAEAERAAAAAEANKRAKAAVEVANTKDGVMINGIVWATKNLGANSPTEYGKIYTWKKAKKACPKGWRLPTDQELESLLNSGSTWSSSPAGRTFGTAPNLLFLPAAGFRFHSDGSLSYVGTNGFYWSSTPSISSENAYYLYFDSDSALMFNDSNRKDGQSVRCVAE